MNLKYFLTDQTKQSLLHFVIEFQCEVFQNTLINGGIWIVKKSKFFFCIFPVCQTAVQPGGLILIHVGPRIPEAVKHLRHD